jgi:hypothetical protein
MHIVAVTSRTNVILKEHESHSYHPQGALPEYVQ